MLLQPLQLSAQAEIWFLYESSFFLFYSEHMECVKLGGVPSPLLMVPYFPFAAYNILTAALTQEYRTMQWFLHLCNHTPQFFYLVKWCIWLSVLVYSIPMDLIFFSWNYVWQLWSSFIKLNVELFSNSLFHKHQSNF